MSNNTNCNMERKDFITDQVIKKEKVNVREDEDQETARMKQEDKLLKKELIVDNLTIIKREIETDLPNICDQKEEEPCPIRAIKEEEIHITDHDLENCDAEELNEQMADQKYKKYVYLIAAQSAQEKKGSPDQRNHLSSPKTNRDKRFQCDQCNYRCNQMNFLRRHKIIHTSETPFHCEQCDYKCNHLSNLKKHKLIHTQEKPHQCDRCDFKCKHSSSLKRHKLIHNNEKLYHCNFCNFKCNQQSSLVNHQVTHTGEKPYQCDQCEYKASRLGDMKRHRLTHYPKKTYNCDHCKYKTTIIKKFERHKTAHADQCD